jgi:hypothetical protein
MHTLAGQNWLLQVRIDFRSTLAGQNWLQINSYQNWLAINSCRSELTWEQFLQVRIELRSTLAGQNWVAINSCRSKLTWDQVRIDLRSGYIARIDPIWPQKSANTPHSVDEHYQTNANCCKQFQSVATVWNWLQVCNWLNLVATNWNCLNLVATGFNQLQQIELIESCNSLNLIESCCNRLKLFEYCCNRLNLVATDWILLQQIESCCTRLNLFESCCNWFKLFESCCNWLNLVAPDWICLQLFDDWSLEIRLQLIWSALVQLWSDLRMVHRHRRRRLVSMIVQKIQLGYLENLNHDLAESLNLYATPRTHPLVRGRNCKSAKLPKLQTFESRVDMGLFVAGILHC